MFQVTAAGKAVLITGCDSRIGSALARQLDELGFTVFAGFQNAEGNPEAEELKEICSARLHILQLDVSSENQILAASLYAVEHLPDGAPGLWAVVHAQSWVALGEIEWIPPQVSVLHLVPIDGTSSLFYNILKENGKTIKIFAILVNIK